MPRLKTEQKCPSPWCIKKDLKKMAHAPLLLYAYGSYGASMDAAFKAAV